MRQRAEGLGRELAPAGRVSPSHHGDEPILQQRGAPKTLAHRVERADRDVEITAVETVEDVEGPARPQIELHERGRRGDRSHQRRGHDDRGVIVDGDRKASVRLRRHERLGLEGPLHFREGVAQRQRQLLRPRCRHHSFRGADEQLILHQIPQAVQGMAQGWLAHAEPFPRPRHAAVLHDGLEHDEQVEIEGSPIHLRHLHVMTMNLRHSTPGRSVAGESKSNARRRQREEAP